MMTVILLIATTWVWGLSPCSAAAPPRPGGSDTTDVRAEGFPRPVALGWTASMGAGLAQGDQVLRDGTHFMATASVAKAVRRSLAVGVVVSLLPATATGTGPSRFQAPPPAC